jgi:uncharacterized zinc-type alcohol dehydrogenase-like protein
MGRVGGGQPARPSELEEACIMGKTSVQERGAQTVSVVAAWAAMAAGEALQPYEYEAGPLGIDQVEIAVSHCGICHSDLSMIEDAWHMSRYPLVAGHEVVGVITAVGESVEARQVGQRVGLGAQSGSCGACRECLAGDQNLCRTLELTMVGRHGGFADRVRCDWQFAVPVPDEIDSADAAPLFCGGVTVCNPIMQFDVKPVDRVGVIGIGGLGHMALQFLDKWGCHVVAFTSTEAKCEEAMELGADETASSRDSAAMKRFAGTLDFIISTVNVPLDWPAIISMLAPRGRLCLVGVVPKPADIPVFEMIKGQKSLCGSNIGSPGTIATMLDFCVRHGIRPVTERFEMSRINEALDRLRAGQVRYRIVLENDFV